MATPAKNITGPNGLARRAPELPKVGSAKPMAILAQLAGIPGPIERRIFAIGNLGPKIKDDHVPRLPDPPFGRQIVMTFPAIYKERPRGDNAVTGQIYPPKAP